MKYEYHASESANCGTEVLKVLEIFFVGPVCRFGFLISQFVFKFWIECFERWYFFIFDKDQQLIFLALFLSILEFFLPFFKLCLEAVNYFLDLCFGFHLI